MMTTYILLLRGINVGGRNKLPMAELKSILQGLGLQKVQTYIQSGNVVCQSEQRDRAALAEQITQAIEQRHGFAPQIFILDRKELRDAITASPFPEEQATPKTLHLFFLDGPPQINLDVLEQAKRENERFELVGAVFYLHAPDGIGRSKLAEKIGKGWGVSVTARNWRTVTKLMELIEEE
jgi:uncharacterized protein (DUF1697 family)